jgi:hypothetical protein
MSNQSNANEPIIYQIRIGGQLGEQWQMRFAQMTLRLADNGDTILTGPVVDQPALYGLLRKVRDLGLPLISVMQIQPDQADGPDATQ